MVLGTELICAPVFFEHLSPAVDAGVRPEAVKALLEGDRNALTEDECLETDFILAVVDGHLDDEAFRRVEAQLGASGAVEYAAFIGFLQMTIRLFQAFDIADPDAIVMAELLVKYARGAPWPPRSGRASTASGAGYAPA